MLKKDCKKKINNKLQQERTYPSRYARFKMRFSLCGDAYKAKSVQYQLWEIFEDLSELIGLYQICCQIYFIILSFICCAFTGLSKTNQKYTVQFIKEKNSIHKFRGDDVNVINSSDLKNNKQC